MKKNCLIFAFTTVFLFCEFRNSCAQTPYPEKLRKLILEKVQFDEVDIVEALEFVRKKSKEIDPSGKGVNIIIKELKKGDFKVTLELNDIPVGDLVRYICMSADLDFKIETYAIIISKKKKK